MKLRRLGGSVYSTLDGRYLIEREDGYTECDYPLCDTLHRKWHTYTGDGRGAIHWIDYVSWHVWDNERDEYLDGNAGHFDTKREAVAWLESFLARGVEA